MDPRQGLAILLVIRDERLVSLCTRAFETKGFRVQRARGVVEAQRSLSRRPVVAVVVDPDGGKKKAVDEWFIVARAARTEPLPLLILFSEEGSRARIREAFDNGTDHYFLKTQTPPRDLAAAVRRLVDHLK
ncbi:MAG TPA: hypothetical protein VJB99_01055 [Patescibacteria group bacterium]|nr:hypothetical protein [Patescibacteria group bacterium]